MWVYVLYVIYVRYDFLKHIWQGQEEWTAFLPPNYPFLTYTTSLNIGAGLNVNIAHGGLWLEDQLEVQLDQLEKKSTVTHKTLCVEIKEQFPYNKIPDRHIAAKYFVWKQSFLKKQLMHHPSSSLKASK